MGKVLSHLGVALFSVAATFGATQGTNGPGIPVCCLVGVVVFAIGVVMETVE